MGAPALPVDNRVKSQRDMQYTINLVDEGLSHRQFDFIRNYDSSYIIWYSGNSKTLNFLLQQISCLKDRRIQLCIKGVDIDNSIYLPFHNLGPTTSICFQDEPEFGSSFNKYVTNLLGLEYNHFLLHIDKSIADRLNKERDIQIKLLQRIKREALTKDISCYSKDNLMMIIFDFIKSEFPYDNSITNSDGSAGENTYLGSTAYGTYDRGKGVCTGRSKLIKLVATNPEINLPCYLASGKHGRLQHEWNEYLTEKGELVEFDASFNTICRLNNLPQPYQLWHHEPAIDNVLKKTR